MDYKKDGKIDVTAMQFLLIPNRQQTHDWILIRSVANGIGIQVWDVFLSNKASSTLDFFKLGKEDLNTVYI